MPSGMLWSVTAETRSVQMGQQRVEGDKKRHAEQKTACRRNPAYLAEFLGLLDSRAQQGPHACGNHDARGKPQKDMVAEASLVRVLWTKEHHGGPKRSHKPGKPASQRSPHECLHGILVKHRRILSGASGAHSISLVTDGCRYSLGARFLDAVNLHRLNLSFNTLHSLS